MSPALRDLLQRIGHTPLLEDLIQASLVQGVKIGGIYRHFKGKHYLVTDVVRAADDWETWCVVYQETTDASHRAVRSVKEFLEDHSNGTPRFQLVG